MSDAMLERMVEQIETLTDALDSDFPGEQREGESAVDAAVRLLHEGRLPRKRPEKVSLTVRWPADLQVETAAAAEQAGLSFNAFLQTVMRQHLEDAP